MSEEFNFLEIFDDMEAQTSRSKDVIVQAPFAWPGGKSLSVRTIIPQLPYRDAYVEVCGGAGWVLLNRAKSKLEVFNDRHAGITAFYRCLKDPEKFQRLCDWLELTIHSREEFVWNKQNWPNYQDDVERAARWYYMIMYSFGSLGRNFGRSIKTNCKFAGKIRDKLVHFEEIHERFRDVQVENLDWKDCMLDYDSHETVFYVDPDYLGTSKGIYQHQWTPDMHQDLLETIFTRIKGFVAVSGIASPLYDKYPWDNRFSWEAFRTIKSVTSGGNNKEHLAGQEERAHDTELLFVKE